MRADCTEALLGTASYVFFYAAPFRYPNTSCGFLFRVDLEELHRNDGVCTPFDSGSLLKHVNRPDASEPVLQYLERHELPVPDHRDYLQTCVSSLFNDPYDYVNGVDPAFAGPLGLTGGDNRRWIHEVRIPDRVELAGGHLEAVFARQSLFSTPGPVFDFFEWCDLRNIATVRFEVPRGDDEHTALRDASIRHIQQQLY